ncbi:hypothetical protein BC938DRAFT_479402 [Jimgerdemannia flammicorona]|uniref:F-box domain-containing protein n=1 Tax=Jimgerdemannia flammicorona TaxID=994334 RepID=A0A433QKY0_9FUNG|nr:hypothetical protein BC938DRAFT_479402 [Jimgerdemannia flammicorona]
MNNLPIDLLIQIFIYVSDPAPWSHVNHLFRKISRDPITIANWSLVRYGPWRAFDRMIGYHSRTLIPAVAKSMLIKGARLPRYLVQNLRG